MVRIRWAAVPLAALAFPVLASAPGDGPAILQRVADAYRRAERFHLAGQIRATVVGPAARDSSTARFVAASGGKGRLRDQLDAGKATMTRISNGEKSWLFIGQLGQYTELSQAMPTPDAMDSLQVAQMGGIVGALLNSYRGIASGADSIQWLRTETLKAGGASRTCDVVRAVYPDASSQASLRRTYWIDRERSVVWKQDTYLVHSGEQGHVTRRETITFRTATLNQPVADSVFVFRAPKGARKVDQFSRGDESPLTGKVAADFSLSDLDGNTHRLTDQRGKVVMLDFWATWCGPCRVQMPSVDRLYREFKDKGLVVYAVNQRESADRARAYLQKNSYSTTTLLDSKGEVGRQYQVNGIPTLVIVDREGKIVAHWVGVHPEDQLREGLKKAGIE